MPARPAAEVQMRIDNLPSAPVFQYPRLRGRDSHPGDGAMSTVPDLPAEATNGVRAGPQAPVKPIPNQTNPPIPVSPWSWCRVLGLVGNCYVALETEDGLVLMDPHAAHERVLYERFMSETEGGEVVSQSMLIPETVELKPRDAANVRKLLKRLKELGFGISEFGGDNFVIDALPAPFARASAAAILSELCSELARAGTRGGKSRMLEESVAQVAARAAVRARDRLTLEEIENLVIDLSRTEMPYTCPHGRPTVILTSLQELNRKFGRH